MTDNGSEFENWLIEDLRFVLSEHFVDDDGDDVYAVYSMKLETITFVGEKEAALL